MSCHMPCHNSILAIQNDDDDNLTEIHIDYCYGRNFMRTLSPRSRIGSPIKFASLSLTISASGTEVWQVNFRNSHFFQFKNRNSVKRLASLYSAWAAYLICLTPLAVLADAHQCHGINIVAGVNPQLKRPDIGTCNHQRVRQEPSIRTLARTLSC